jgi:hypothetical protein
MDNGYIYILKNSAYIADLVKIGCTKKGANIRAKELYTTGVPEPFHVVYIEDVTDYRKVEKMIHKSLDNYRYNKQREFFKLPIQEAILKVQEVTQREIYKVKNQNNILTLRENMTFRWLCHSGDFIFMVRYQEDFIDSLSDPLTPIDVWPCGEGDQVLISNRPGSDEFALSMDEFIILDVGECINGIIGDVIDIYPGDRIAWISKSKTFSSSTNEDYFILAILDCQKKAKIAGFSDPQNMVFIDGIPAPFGTNVDEINKILTEIGIRKVFYEAIMRIRNLGKPLT